MVTDADYNGSSRREGAGALGSGGPDAASSQLPVTGSGVTDNWESDRQARVVLRVTRTADDGTAEETTAVELPGGDVVVGVDGVEQPQRHQNLVQAIQAESVLRAIDDRRTAFWSPILPSWELTELLTGDIGFIDINGATWWEDDEFGWWFENPEDDPNYEEVALAVGKVPGYGGMTGGPVRAIRLERLGDRYWWYDYTLEAHGRTQASTPLDGLEWFSGEVEGKIIEFTSALLDGLDDDVIAGVLPGSGPAMWVNGDLWDGSRGPWRRRPVAPTIDIGPIELEAGDVCEQDRAAVDYQWLYVTLDPVELEVAFEPEWWCVVIADGEPDQADLDYLADAEYGSSTMEVPAHPPAVILGTGGGTRWYGVATSIQHVARKLRDATPNAIWFGGSQEHLWLLNRDGQASQAWRYTAVAADAPADADRFQEVDVTG